MTASGSSTTSTGTTVPGSSLVRYVIGMFWYTTRYCTWYYSSTIQSKNCLLVFALTWQPDPLTSQSPSVLATIQFRLLLRFPVEVAVDELLSCTSGGERPTKEHETRALQVLFFAIVRNKVFKTKQIHSIRYPTKAINKTNLSRYRTSFSNDIIPGRTTSAEHVFRSMDPRRGGVCKSINEGISRRNFANCRGHQSSRISSKGAPMWTEKVRRRYDLSRR